MHRSPRSRMLPARRSGVARPRRYFDHGPCREVLVLIVGHAETEQRDRPQSLTSGLRVAAPRSAECAPAPLHKGQMLSPNPLSRENRVGCCPLTSPKAEQIARFLLLEVFLRFGITASELDGADGAIPPADLAGFVLVHVEKVCHHRLQHWFASVIRSHRNRTAKYLQRPSIPVFDDIVPGGKAGINEGTQILTNLLASMPIRDAKVAGCVLGETVETLPECFVINFLPEREQPLRRLRFRHGSGCRFLLFVYQRRHCCCSLYRRLTPFNTQFQHPVR